MQGRPHSTEPIAEQHSHCLGMSTAPLLITWQYQLISAAEKRDALAAVAAKDKEGHEKPGSVWTCKNLAFMGSTSTEDVKDM